MREEPEIVIELASIMQRILFTHDDKLKALFMGQRDALRWVLQLSGGSSAEIKGENEL